MLVVALLMYNYSVHADLKIRAFIIKRKEVLYKNHPVVRHNLKRDIRIDVVLDS